MQVCFADAGCQTPYHHSVVLPRRDEGLKAHLAATSWLNKKKILLEWFAASTIRCFQDANASGIGP